MVERTFTNVAVPPPPPNAFTVVRLVGDDASRGATHIDTNLVNPWGLGFGPTGILWVANNRTGTSTMYSATGAPQPLVVRIPSDSTLAGGAPTGLVLNLTTDFAIAGSGPAEFIFVGLDGVISAWNESSGSNAMRVANRAMNGAAYTSVTMASNRGENFLYATDFRNNAVDVFDTQFAYVGSFKDPSVPAGFAPFGIQNVAGKLFVAFARTGAPGGGAVPGVGNGVVVVFNPDGTVARRFATNGSLNAPWAITTAPPEFGPFTDKILIGNFGDGKIGVYDLQTGAFVDFLRDGATVPIAIDGLRGLAFGPSFGSTTLYFTAGPARETHGLVGTISP